MPPRVSVLMALHNAASTLEEAVRSIQDQTFEDWELIILDDGSTDESAVRATALAASDARIRVVSLPRQGYAATMNAGWDEARGEEVTCMDADDRSLPTRLAEQTAFLDAHPEVDVCGTWMREFGSACLVHTRPGTHEALVAHALFETPLLHASALVRREPVRRHGLRYRDHVPAAEDFDWWVRCSEFLRFACLPRVLYEYRRHADSVGESRKERVRTSVWTLVCEQLALLGVDPIPEEAALHRRIVEWHCVRSHAEHQAIGSWFGRLEHANALSFRFDAAALHSVLAERWYQLSRLMAARGWDARGTWRQHPLAAGRQESLRERCGFWIRCMRRLA